MLSITMGIVEMNKATKDESKMQKTQSRNNVQNNQLHEHGQLIQQFEVQILPLTTISD